MSWLVTCGPGVDCGAQHGARGVGVLGRTEHAGAGELHGAVADPADGARAESERIGLVDFWHAISLVGRQQLGVVGMYDNGA